MNRLVRKLASGRSSPAALVLEKRENQRDAMVVCCDSDRGAIFARRHVMGSAPIRSNPRGRPDTMAGIP